MQHLRLPHPTRSQWLALALLLIDVGFFVFHVDFTGWLALVVYWPPLLAACYFLIPQKLFKGGKHV